MIDESRAADFIESLYPDRDPVLQNIYCDAVKAGVPVIRPQSGRLLSAVCMSARPGRILEVGAGVGYSALLLAAGMARGGELITIEQDEARAKKARENFAAAGMNHVITLLEGDAGQILPGLAGSFDFVFMDAAKGQYSEWLELILPKLSEGAVLFSDNVFFGGDILLPRTAVERRDRTIHKRMREYLYTLTHTRGLETAVLHLEDGVAISIKRENYQKEKKEA